jgi:hypothetical protein
VRLARQPDRKQRPQEARRLLLAQWPRAWRHQLRLLHQVEGKPAALATSSPAEGLAVGQLHQRHRQLRLQRAAESERGRARKHERRGSGVRQPVLASPQQQRRQGVLGRGPNGAQQLLQHDAHGQQASMLVQHKGDVTLG